MNRFLVVLVADGTAEKRRAGSEGGKATLTLMKM
jgi:hypothetical protein